ncbi:XrtA/PEP-CTERM system exopolysaccharide export protein [Parvularcula dongshanensis]|uniref:Polysaccharide export outer membrane protein n=1 Tax=Parvularcula dongshanensis TaxID=1173995 RepID=A0A840I697_9PROT|nr:XrtA/PEP-CTERM system exopolysaccharide export protein [Parvularcula dongshanensis]MBB4659791.1 polysaccharide export outer membrane protein [Parvularcula dongshanensis]
MLLQARLSAAGFGALALLALAACQAPIGPQAPGAGALPGGDGEGAVELAPDYLIGANDALQIFVWRAAELSTNIVVRPDGRISTPLVEDMMAAGKTPTQLARDIEGVLSEYVKNPEVTVIVDRPTGDIQQQVRIIGEVVQPTPLPYSSNMTVLDVMLQVGGLTEFASGNRTKLIRGDQTYRVRLDDLLRRGDVSANVPVQPGDIIIVPESRF